MLHSELPCTGTAAERSNQRRTIVVALPQLQTKTLGKLEPIHFEPFADQAQAQNLTLSLTAKSLLRKNSKNEKRQNSI